MVMSRQSSYNITFIEPGHQDKVINALFKDKKLLMSSKACKKESELVSKLPGPFSNYLTQI